jgi:TolA-binding protein
VATDENEKPLPPHVERALAEARRKSTRASRTRAEGDAPSRPARPKESRGLALVPVVVCVLFLALLMPRASAPETVPLPQVDERALAQVRDADRALAARARSERLAPELLAVGTGFRGVQLVEASGTPDEDATVRARTELNDALRVLRQRDPAMEGLVTLRAVQLEAFLVEVARFEASGESTRELQELAGAFVDRMRAVGWVEGTKLVPDERQLRVAYKAMWNAVVGDLSKSLALTLDEQRALYSLYLAKPHPAESRRAELEAERRVAKTEADCSRAAVSARRATERWRAEKIRQLGRIDPSYPTDYALGVAYYREEQYDLAVAAFRSWVDAHPDGPWSLRAKNHLKAAIRAAATF